MLQYLVFLGAAVQMVGVYIYIKKILQGSIKPNRISWLLWSFIPMIATAAALVDGVRLAVIPVLIVGLGPLVVFLYTFKQPKSYWKLERFDYVCGAFSILALVLWWITKLPYVAIIFSLISDFFACIPTLIKSWKHPESESVSPYAAGIFNALTAFFAIKNFGFSESAFPIYLLLINIFLVAIIYFRKNRCKLQFRF